MASKAVNVPVNSAIKEKDVNAKLQLYGIYAGTSPMHVRAAARLNPSSAAVANGDVYSICQRQSAISE